MQAFCGQSFAGKFSVTALQNRADGVFDYAAACFETLEIVRALYDFARLFDFVEIDGHDDMFVRGFEHGTAMFRDIRFVAISLAFCIETRVEIVGYDFARKHAHVVRKMRVDGKRNLVDGDRSVCVEMHDLSLCVNACVRATACGCGGFRAESFFESFFKDLLNAQSVELSLPADVPCSEIGNHRAISHNTKPPKIIWSMLMPIVGK